MSILAGFSDALSGQIQAGLEARRQRALKQAETLDQLNTMPTEYGIKAQLAQQYPQFFPQVYETQLIRGLSNLLPQPGGQGTQDQSANQSSIPSAQYPNSLTDPTSTTPVSQSNIQSQTSGSSASPYASAANNLASLVNNGMSNNPVPTELNYGGLKIALNPALGAQQAAQRETMVQNAKTAGEMKLSQDIFNQHLGVIQDALAQVPPVDTSVPGSAQLTALSGGVRSAAGRLDPRFREAESTIKASLGPFLTSVEGLSRSRISQTELSTLGNMITDLPYLNGPDRTRRLGLINNFMIGHGINTQNTPLGQSVSQPTGQPSGNTIRVRKKADGQTGTINASDFDPSKYQKL